VVDLVLFMERGEQDLAGRASFVQRIHVEHGRVAQDRALLEHLYARRPVLIVEWRMYYLTNAEAAYARHAGCTFVVAGIMATR
jgi:hypothetical protein